MKITNVTATVLRLPQISSAADGTQDDLIITVETDEGITGYGEVDTAPYVGKAVVDAYMSHGTCYGLREVIIGTDPFDYEQIWNDMWSKTYYYGRSGPVMHVMSGIDMAIWDIMGKAVGKPVHKLLGGSYADKVRAYASALMPDTPDEVKKMTGEYASQGYTAIKFGWGPLGYDVHNDIELIKTARKAAGDKVDIMIDIGKRYRLKEAIYVAKALEQLNIYWLEEPLPAEDYIGYKRLTESTTMRIATGEEESGRLAFARLINETHIDVVQPDMSRCGGLTEAKKIAMMTADANVLCVPHAFKTGVLVAASIQFIASVQHAPFLEFSVTESAIRKELLLNPFIQKDGFVEVPQTPGLGIELNPEVILKYGVNIK
ncbi:mandelate racemase/muconate lactonizing enzyme family protein [Agriterribacter humi]|jgi:L-alanine-DL-glutamate epimerase-like enolase superfamily enzyme|uniref:mandelate racemase/muconate lactonizing enzyme family protein n=1 Tax=Agriterribacter humi TaxID=1104781 RepID=UPI0012651B75|nr:mandelate racemase/muconate lactonizing enzyme family protein [Agriterribacter humi]